MRTRISEIKGEPNLPRLIHRHYDRIMRLVDLEVEGEAVFPDCYRHGIQREFLRSSGSGSKTQKRVIAYEFTESYARNEPRIDFIKRSLELAVREGQFSTDGETLAVDGFRFRNLKNWANYGPVTIQQNVGDISGYCNCKCEFCYEIGARRAALPWRRTMLSPQEAATRIRYYSSQTKKGLVAATNFTLEPFTNPRCTDILEMIRAADSSAWIYLFTNGSLLGKDIVSRLAKLQPLLIVLSLNASTPETWMRTMRGRSEEDARSAFSSLALLREHEIPTIGSYVPWPTKPLSDLCDAVRFMDRMDVVRARICLPTFTRFHSPKPPFDPEVYWPELLAVVQSIRREVRVPVGFMPATYEVKTLGPTVLGVLKNSPAEEAGIRYGDRLLAVDGQEIYTVPEARSILGQRAMAPDKAASTTFTLERMGRQIRVAVPEPEDACRTAFPYRAFARWGPTRYRNSLGIHFMDGFQLTSIARLAEICGEYRGKKILVLASDLMEPHFREAFALAGSHFPIFEAVKLFVGKPRPRYFGGSVVIGDLWVLSDLIDFVGKWIKDTGIRPDAVLVPGSFLSVGKHDLLGHSLLEFERELGIEIRPISCLAIAD